MKAKDKDQVFRVSNVFYYILRGRRLIGIFAVVGLIVGVILSGLSYLRGEMSKQYQITSSIAIIAKTSSGAYASKNNNPDTEDVRLAQEITDSAIYILRSERTLTAAIENAGIDGVSVKDIQSNLSLNQYNETQIIEINLYWRSSTEGVRILEAINAVSGEILLETLKIGNVSVVNSPTSRYIIGGSVSASTWIIGAAFGALIAIVICVLKLFLSPVLTHVKDTERLFSLKALGAVPYMRNFSDSAPFAAEHSKADKGITSLAYVLMNRMEVADRNKVIITSSNHGEGRTVLTANIARHVAASGRKTLMVDADFKNPRLSSMFKGQIPYEKTLNAVYYGDADETDALCHIEGCLDLLPVIVSDKAISLTDSMLDVIERIAARYDFVIFDCAPVGLDAEVIKLKRLTDITLLAVKFDDTELENIEESKKMLTESGINIIGCAVTSVKTFRDIMREAQKLSLFMRSTRKRAEKAAKKAEKKKKKAAKHKKSDKLPKVKESARDKENEKNVKNKENEKNKESDKNTESENDKGNKKNGKKSKEKGNEKSKKNDKKKN